MSSPSTKQMSKNKSKQQKTNTSYKESSTFTTVFFYCILIIVLPIVGFFCSKSFIFDNKYFELTQIQSNIYAAIVAVVALHLALALYLYRAYFDHNAEQQRLTQKLD